MNRNTYLQLAGLGLLLSEMQNIDNSIYSDNKPKNKLSPDEIVIDNFQKKPPKGCKEYFFNKDGEFTNGEEGQIRMRRDETVFYCHASNDKNAKRKFDMWLKNQSVV
jgi:hypothetical protein